jgi:hypothetical protein
MRGQKVSMRGSISEELRGSENRYFPRQSEEDEQDEEIDSMLAEREKRISYIESKKRFNEERAKRNGKPSKSTKCKKKSELSNPLGIPVGDYIYFGPGPSGLPSIFNRPSFVQERKEEEYKIVRSKGKSYRFEKTLSSHIFRVLLKRDRPLHVNDIILALQKLGVLKNSNHHTYSVVYRTLTRDHALFERLDRATFSLREGFVAKEQPTKLDRVVEINEEFSSLQELVVAAYRHLAPQDGGCCPSVVFQHLKTLGFNGPYKTIYEAMQSSNFRRIGFSYYLTAGQQAGNAPA